MDFSLQLWVYLNIHAEVKSAQDLNHHQIVVKDFLQTAGIRVRPGQEAFDLTTRKRRFREELHECWLDHRNTEVFILLQI